MIQVINSAVREALLELSDEALQRRLWLSSEGEVGSFTEAIEQLFDDSGLERAYEAGHEVYGAETDSVIRQIDALQERIDDDIPPVQVLEHPLLVQIRSLAKVALTHPLLAWPFS